MLRKMAVDENYTFGPVNDTSAIWRLTETIQLPMDSVDSRSLHVWYTTDSVDTTGKASGITPMFCS